MKLAFVNLIYNEFRCPPIGLINIATYVKQNLKDAKVKIIDNTFEDVYDQIDRFKPDIIGITTFTSFYQDILDFTKIIKSRYPKTKIIVGGPHITSLPESMDKNFDYAILGQGLKSFQELLKAISSNKSVKTINGLVYWQKGKLKINPRKEGNELNLDQAHVMDYTLINKKYWKRKFIAEITDFKVSSVMISSIGCPFDCLFCACKACWGNIRYISLDKVVNEIKDLYYNFGVRHIDFTDDLFAVNKARLKEFCNKLKQAGLLGKITFECFARADVLDDEMCVLLKKLNVRALKFGFESGSDRILKYIKNNPRLSVADNRKAILLCKKYGFNCFGGLVTANPTETKQDFKMNLDFMDFAIRNGVMRTWTQVLVPFPGTKIWEMAKQKGNIPKGNIDWNSMQVHNKENPVLLDKSISQQEFLDYYNLTKKKGRFLGYKLLLKTISTNPLNLFYFIKDSPYYLKRFFKFVKE